MSFDTANINPEKAAVTAIKTVEITPGKSFVANGRKYTVSDTFTIGRLEQINSMEEELSMFSDKKSCHDVMVKAMQLINEYKPGEAHTLLYNKIDSDRRNPKIMHFILRVCAGYINFEGEDLAYLTEEQIRIKINDWSEEGLDARPFIYSALASYKELLQNYKKDILNILTEIKSVKQALQMEMDTNYSANNENNGQAPS